MRRLLTAIASAGALIAEPVAAVDYVQCEAMRRRHLELESAYFRAISIKRDSVCGTALDAIELDRTAKWRQENPRWKEKAEANSTNLSPESSINFPLPPTPTLPPTPQRSTYLPKTFAEYEKCARKYPRLTGLRFGGPAYYSYSKSYHLPSYIADLENRHNMVLRDINKRCP